MAGRNGQALFLGLPGNPVSAFVTALLFVLPLVRHMSGASDPLPPLRRAILTQEMPPVAGRTQYLRGIFDNGEVAPLPNQRSEEHTSELQSLMRTSYAVFCLKKKHNIKHKTRTVQHNTQNKHTLYNKL